MRPFYDLYHNDYKWISLLIFKGWADVSDEAVNVTHYKSSKPLLFNEAWADGNPKTSSKNSQRPFCVLARFGRSCF